jgi:penicillin-binding protein 1A
MASSSTSSTNSFLKTVAKWTVILGLIGGLLGGAGVAGIFYVYGHDLPDIITREDYEPKELSRVYDTEGRLISEFYRPGGRRTVVSIDELPDHVLHAFMAAEDASFMEHEGIDYWGMLRAFYYAIIHNRRLQGTSTITQQVVKNLVLAPERTIERKVKEIILARELERNLSKRDILFLYVNHVYLGHGVNGIQEAARYYFGKPAKELSVGEAAVIAGMLPGPANYNPIDHPKNAKGRRSYVLGQLWEKGFIEEATYRSAKEEPIETVPYTESHPYMGAAPYFVEHVRQRLVERYGAETVYTGGLRIHTTLDAKRHREAKRASRGGLHTYDRRREYFEHVDHIDASNIESFKKRQAEDIGSGALSTDEVYRAVVVGVEEAADDSSDASVQLRLGQRAARLALEPRRRILRDKESLKEVLEPGDILKVTPLKPKSDEHGSIPVAFDPGPEVALVSIDPNTRHVQSLVGGYKFAHNQYNHATQMRRQTGSTFKPFVYGAALESGSQSGGAITPATIYLDSPAVFRMPGGKKWSPRNSDESWRGPIRLREGLGASRNVVAVRVLEDVGLGAASEFAKRMGVQSKIVDNHTMVMGSSEMTPVELVNAYTTIASGGVYAEPQFIKKVVTNRGETDVYRVDERRVLAPDVAYLLTDLMTSVVEGYVDSEGRRRGGTAHSLSALTQTVAGKTGTTNDTRDAWFVGFTPQLATGVWVGFDDNRSLGPKEYGGRVAGPIWLDYMKSVLGDKEPHDFKRPKSGVVEARIDPATGKLVRGDKGIKELFLAGSTPTQYAPTESDSAGENFLMNQFRNPSDGSGSKEAGSRKKEGADSPQEAGARP